MPSKEFKQIGEQKFTMPPDLLTLSPEELDQKLAELSGEALSKGTSQVAELDSIEKKLPISSSHKKTVAELKSASMANQAELEKGLAKNGINVPAQEAPEEPANAWTPEMVANMQAKMAAKKEAQERRRVLGELTDTLQSKDNQLQGLIAALDPENITGEQEKQIEALGDQIERKFKENNINEVERIEILKLLPNFVEAKKASLTFHITRDKATAKKMLEGYKKGTIQGEVNPSTRKIIPPKRINFLTARAKAMTKELNNYKLAV